MGKRTVVGVDGCRGGWLAIALTEGQGATHSVETTFSDVLLRYGSASLILADIPIGLPDGTAERECDKLARQRLGKPRSSSVFPVPCRRAVHASDPSTVNQQVSGRRLSRQSLGILRKIAEADASFQRAEQAKPPVREIHPEVCFWALNGEHAMRHAKRSTAGIAEREAVLARFYPGTKQVVQALLGRYSRKDLSHDDILDALVAAVTARGPLHSLPEHPPTDGEGLPMEIVFAASCDPPCMSVAKEQSLRIAILGWGSLVWDPRELPLRPPWSVNGPMLPLEFSRVSSDGRLTLVIDADHGERLATRFAFSPRGVLEDSVSDLRDREGTVWRNIGYVYPPHREQAWQADVARRIGEWARAQAIDAVVWTDLRPNFEEQLGEAFSVERALAYLQRLPKGIAKRAQEYIGKAPKEIMTPLRRRVESIGWKAVLQPTNTE